MVRLALLRLIESFFRHWWLYLLPVIIAAAASGYFAFKQKPAYTSSGTLYVQTESLVASLNDLPGSAGTAWVTPAEMYVTQLSSLLHTEAFLRSVVKNTPLSEKLNVSPENIGTVIVEINKSLRVDKINDNLVSFSATAETSGVAKQLASQIVESYVLWKLNSQRQDSIAAQDFFGGLLTPRQKELDDARSALETYLTQNPAPPRGADRPALQLLKIEQLQKTITTAEERVNELRTKDDSAKLSQVQAERNLRQTYLTVDAPQEPLTPTNGLIKRLQENILFLLVGIALSILGVVGSAVIDPSLRFPIDVRNRLFLPTLGMPPRSRVTYQPSEQPIVTSSEPGDMPLGQRTQQPFGSSLAQSSQE